MRRDQTYVLTGSCLNQLSQCVNQSEFHIFKLGCVLHYQKNTQCFTQAIWKCRAQNLILSPSTELDTHFQIIKGFHCIKHTYGIWNTLSIRTAMIDLISHNGLKGKCQQSQSRLICTLKTYENSIVSRRHSCSINIWSETRFQNFSSDILIDLIQSQ